MSSTRRNQSGKYGVYIAPKARTPVGQKRIYRSALGNPDEDVRTYDGRRYLRISLPLSKSNAERYKGNWSKNWRIKVKPIDRRRR
jgi:hypothetical protein